MNTGKKAEEYVRAYFEQRGVTLIQAGKGDSGYDFKDINADFFVEVKGSTATDTKKVPFRYFTNKEYEKARSCHKEGHKYEIHLVVDVNSSSPKHYVIPGDMLLENGRPEIVWFLPIRKNIQQFRI